MKLRGRFNSVRLHLTKSEVSTLQCQSECAEPINCPGGASLAYSLRGSESPAAHAEFSKARQNNGSAGLQQFSAHGSVGERTS
jgi:hypothetical protein